MFDVAYYWRLDPATVLALPLSRFELYENQIIRIAEEIKNEGES